MQTTHSSHSGFRLPPDYKGLILDEVLQRINNLHLLIPAMHEVDIYIYTVDLRYIT